MTGRRTSPAPVLGADRRDRARRRQPQGVPGPADRGRPANGCPSPTVTGTCRIITLAFRNAGFFRGCDAPETGGILFQ